MRFTWLHFANADILNLQKPGAALQRSHQQEQALPQQDRTESKCVDDLHSAAWGTRRGWWPEAAHLLDNAPAALQAPVLWPVKLKLNGGIEASIPVCTAVGASIVEQQAQHQRCPVLGDSLCKHWLQILQFARRHDPQRPLHHRGCKAPF
jgi:hypothetical protein